MTIKEYIKYKRFKQVEIGKETGINFTLLNRFLNGWTALNPKHHKKFCSFLGISQLELDQNKVIRK